MQTIEYDSEKMFHELDFLQDDAELKKTIKACIDAQKEVGAQKLKTDYKPNRLAETEVSEETLNQIIASNEMISDIRTNTNISNCIVFHTTNLDGSVIDQRLIELRQKADNAVKTRLIEVFGEEDPLTFECSGHFWYPRGGFMGWHTNLRKPGWRMYINYAEEENKSFLRYRDPDTQKIVTAWDKIWNFRLFKITPLKPFWHAVYSDTNRFSLGYLIKKS